MAEANRISDEELALELIRRLNGLCENEEVRAVIGRLIDYRLSCSGELSEHQTLGVCVTTQYEQDGYKDDYAPGRP